MHDNSDIPGLKSSFPKIENLVFPLTVSILRLAGRPSTPGLPLWSPHLFGGIVPENHSRTPTGPSLG